MHRSQPAGYIIDWQTEDLDAAAAFWSATLGLPGRRHDDPAEALGARRIADIRR